MVAVLGAFWEQVRHDLERGDQATRRWLDTPAFRAWSLLSLPSVASAEIRARLLEVWQERTRVA